LLVDRRDDFLAEFFTAFGRDVFLQVFMDNFLKARKTFVALRRRLSGFAAGAFGSSMVGADAGANATTFSCPLASSTIPRRVGLELI
jgi:hypothetical protein